MSVLLRIDARGGGDGGDGGQLGGKLPSGLFLMDRTLLLIENLSAMVNAFFLLK